jgi:hypothetical protein
LRRRKAFSLVILAVLALTGCEPWQRSITRASETLRGDAANGTYAGDPSLSRDGGVVAFRSDATNLVAGDTNGQPDAFVRNGQKGPILRASVSSSGVASNGATRQVAVSGDGEHVIFMSEGSNLVPGDTNGVADVFVRDLANSTTERVSVSSAGAQGNQAVSYGVGISDDGRYVTFTSSATNLVPGDTNNRSDVFVHHRSTGTTERVSLSSGGVQANDSAGSSVISGDGHSVIWASGATNLVAGDTNGTYDGFVRDLEAGTTERFNVSSAEEQAEGGDPVWYAGLSISRDGRLVTFIEDATNLVPGDTNGFQDVFVRDLQEGRTERVSVSSGGTQQNNHAADAAISATGRSIAFLSDATNLVPGDSNGLRDVFVRDLEERSVERVNETYEGKQATGGHALYSVAISSTGRFVAFESSATLTPRDSTTPDVYVRDVDRPGFDNIYPTANWNHACVDGDMGLNCLTDGDLLRVFAEDSLAAVQIFEVHDVLDDEYEPTSLDVEWDADPQYTGDTETDIIYQVGEATTSELLGRTWCDDAVSGTDLCDQHYVRFDDDVDTIGRHTICHETGHAVGLTHGAEADPVQRSDNPSLMGCMSTAVDPGNEAGTESLGNQNFDMIKAIYPLPGANEHD